MSNIPEAKSQLNKFLKYKISYLVGIFAIIILLIFLAFKSDIPKALSLLNEFLKDWSGLLIGVIGTVISSVVFYYNRKKDKFNSLSEVFMYLNEDKHREARRVLYTKDDKEIKNEDKILSSHLIVGFDAISKNYPLIRVCEDIARDDLNHMGVMLKNNLVPENEFLERYCTTVLRLKEKLSHNIDRRRKVRRDKNYVKGIDYLIIRAEKYVEKNKERTKTIQPE